jgi:hypothetical protein
MHRAKIRATAIASRNPTTSASMPRQMIVPSCRSMPSATEMIALYSGPTTIAPTIRIDELVSMPQAPISPANTRRTKKLGAYCASCLIRDSISSHTGARSPSRGRCQAGSADGAASAASAVRTVTDPSRPRPKLRNCRRMTLADSLLTSNCTASPAGWVAAARSTTRFCTPWPAARLATSRSVSPAGLTRLTCSIGRQAPSGRRDHAAP